MHPHLKKNHLPGLSPLWLISLADRGTGEGDHFPNHFFALSPLWALEFHFQRGGQAVFEPFLGSGTTLIAAQSVGRVCYDIEIDPIVVDVAIRRWQAFTGETARRVDGGETFDDTQKSAVVGQRTPTQTIVEET
jgi:hypothetical protein